MFHHDHIDRFVAALNFTPTEGEAIKKRAEEAANKYINPPDGRFSADSLEEVLGSKELVDTFTEMWEKQNSILNPPLTVPFHDNIPRGVEQIRKEYADAILPGANRLHLAQAEFRGALRMVIGGKIPKNFGTIYDLLQRTATDFQMRDEPLFSQALDHLENEMIAAEEKAHREAAKAGEVVT
ncbi:hypothetical protein H7X87_00745 [Acetobacteraceae bacterium]|nr:hypothetical protein [Candidatus Parcubacteria bacterium]